MNEHKKILFVITKANWGGAQKYVYDLAIGASKAGYEVAVAYGEPGLLASKLASAGIRTLHIAALRRDIETGSDISAFFALGRAIRQEQPDIVHLNSSKAAGLGAFAARLEGVPRIIYTAHGWAFNETRPLWQKLLLRMAAEATIYLAHETICVSSAIRRDIGPVAFARNKFTIIHNGIECQPLRARADARTELLPHHAHKRWVGMVSELHPTKRIEDAIDAFARIAKTHADTILLVCGEGEERVRLEERIAMRGLAGRVFLLGFVEGAAQHLNAFDLFLHTSQSEALAYVLLEAGCARLPVVATRVGGIPEIIESEVSGLLVPPRSPAAVAEALDGLLTNPARAEQMGEHLHARVMRNFSLEGMARATLARYAR